jgi:hypothetical protein
MSCETKGPWIILYAVCKTVHTLISGQEKVEDGYGRDLTDSIN